ncbi:MAG: hypothetical protein EXR79_00185 [Myxococcales bacterium]|nr:hypothetical protein [Myxococcales bacterium]
MKCDTFLVGAAALLATLAVGWAPMAVWAQTAPQRAVLAVRVIGASKAPAARVDPRLRDIERELKAFQSDFNEFTLVREQQLSLDVGMRGVVKLTDGADFVVTFLGLTPGPAARARCKVETPRNVQTLTMAIGGRTLDILPAGDRATIVSTSYER